MRRLVLAGNDKEKLREDGGLKPAATKREYPFHRESGTSGERGEGAVGNDDFEQSARVGILELEDTAEFLDALAHAVDTDADAAWAEFDGLRRNTAAIVANAHSYITVGL
jgi:hypothetical protein